VKALDVELQVQELHVCGHACPGRCPSGDNAATWGYNEENCEGKSKNGAAAGTGAVGNLCHVECSNSGICDYATGQCKCFKGFYGTNCGMMSEAAGSAWCVPYYSFGS
jgi:hypothetical protein